MIDLHVHIVPGIDDGAEDMATAVKMARVALADGVKTVFATPHSVQWGVQPGRADLEGRVEELRASLRQEGLNLQVLPGVEAYLAPNLVRQIEEGQIFTLNRSRYLLVELPFDHYPPYTDDVLFELQLRGLVPILAHPERNVTIQRDISRLFTLAERGVRAQVTAASILGAFGSKARESARQMIQHSLVQCIASDAHSFEGGRSPVLSAAVAQAAVLVGQERAQAMVTTVPQAVVADREIEWEPAEVPSRGRSFWSFWR